MLTEHGHYTIDSAPQLMVAQLFDSWNLHTTERYVADFQGLASQFCQRPWAAFFDLRPWLFLTEDAYPVMNQQINWCLANKLNHCVYLSTKSSLAKFMLSRIRDRSVPEGMQFIHTDNVDEALALMAEWQYPLPTDLAEQIRNTQINLSL